MASRRWVGVCMLGAAAVVLTTVCGLTAAPAVKMVSFKADVIPVPGESYYDAVRAEMARAKKSIRCAMYLAMFDKKRPGNIEGKLISDLIAAHKRGVKVSVILDRNDGVSRDKRRGATVDTKNEAAYLYLQRKGVDVSYDSNDVVLHSKLIVIDDAVTIVGSANWSYSAMKKNHEASVIIRSPEVAKVFAQSFAAIERKK